MSSSALRLQISKDRRDTLLLVMASDASRVKIKAREALRTKIRQTGYRQVRYQRFKGCREDVLEDEIRERRRLRRIKSIQAMETWLSAQAQANSEEGSPRDVPEVSSISHEVSIETPNGDASPSYDTISPISNDVVVVSPDQPLITSFLS